MTKIAELSGVRKVAYNHVAKHHSVGALLDSTTQISYSIL